MRRFVATAIVFVSGLTFSAPGLNPGSASPSSAARTEFVAGEVLVKFKPSQSAQERISAIGRRGHGVARELRQPGWMQLKVGEGETVAQVVAAYRRDPNVEYAQPNYIYRVGAAANDPHYSQLWALHNTGQPVSTGSYLPNAGSPGVDLNVQKAWDHITDCSSAVVAVIDTGVNYKHEDLASNMWDGGPGFPLHGADFVDGDSDPMDLNGHGTHVAAIIGAGGNNATGTAGACWKARIMALRALDASGLGTTATILQAIDFALNHGAKVLNMSFGGRGYDPAFAAAVQNARARDAVVVTAAGNERTNLAFTPVYPCAYPHTLCVAALDQNGWLARFSNYGAEVDVAAPGTNIVSATAGQWSTAALSINWITSSGWNYVESHLVNAALTGGADERVYQDFDLRGKPAAVANFSIYSGIPDARVRVKYRAGGGDPFAGGILLDSFVGRTGVIIRTSYDISDCAGTICSVGFQLLTATPGAGQEVTISGFSIETLQPSNSAYATWSGTSVATPYVAGLAAMLRSYNPQYTSDDVVRAIKSGSRTSAELSWAISGGAADFMSSLSYISAPTGIKAQVR